MDGAEKASAECARTCCFVHRTNLSPAVTSFFKIMVGDDFSRVLFLPPKFACAVSALVGQETVLQDSHGQTWEVMISEINGSIVFQQGWSTFASDHDLEIGDLVLFFRTRESHFLVKIYDRTACEKLIFSERSKEKKRKRDSLSSKKNDGTSCKTNKNSIDRNCSSPSIRTDHEVNGDANGLIISQNTTSRDDPSKRSETVSKAEYVIEMDYMLNGDLAEKQGEDRRCILDLSVFEVSTVAEEIIPQVDDNEVAKQRASEAVLSDAFDHDKSESFSDKDSYFLSKSRHSTTCAVNPEEDGGNVSTMSKNGVIKECQIGKNQVSLPQKSDLDNDNGQRARKETNDNSGASSIPISVLTKTCQSGKITKGIKEEPAESKSYPCHREATQSLCVETMVIKEEPAEIKPSLCSQESIKKLQGESSKATKSILPRSVKENDEVHPVVKTEVIDLVEGSSMTTNRPDFSTFLATCRQSFVELPERLPFPITRGMASVERKMVILRDQAGRLWPVMYHDKPSLQFLAKGWEALSEANSINSGDQCLFTIEDESDGIYSVSLVQR